MARISPFAAKHRSNFGPAYACCVVESFSFVANIERALCFDCTDCKANGMGHTCAFSMPGNNNCNPSLIDKSY